MEGYITEEHLLLRKSIGNLIRAHMPSEPLTCGFSKDFLREVFTDLGKHGVLGLNMPKSLGGMGKDYLSYILALEEIAKMSPSLAVSIAVHCSVSMSPIVGYGTDFHKQKYIPDMVTGRKIGAFGLTEAGSGSDSASISTKFEEFQDYYLLNGSKIFCTNGNLADIFIVTATQDKALKTEGIAAFIAERQYDGFTVYKGDDKLGLTDSDWGELYFENCKIPKENLLAGQGKGFKLFMQTLNGGRISIAAVSLGLAEGVMDQAIQYVTRQREYDPPLLNSQTIQYGLADMAVEIEASKNLVYTAARVKDLGMNFVQHASMAKLYSSTMCMKVVNQAFQIYGEYGYTKKFPIGQYLCDARAMEIVEGTSEIQKTIIAKGLLN